MQDNFNYVLLYGMYGYGYVITCVVYLNSFPPSGHIDQTLDGCAAFQSVDWFVNYRTVVCISYVSLDGIYGYVCVIKPQISSMLCAHSWLDTWDQGGFNYYHDEDEVK